jgi:hypothetical protein
MVDGFSKNSTQQKDTIMTTKDFTIAILVDQTPAEAFKAINNVRGWWSKEIEGPTKKLNDEFTYHFEDLHKSRMKIIESVPNEKVVWLVMENYFKFTKDTTEWTGNKIIFEITEQGSKTQIRMTQEGLVPEYECFDICRDSWSNYVQNSLRSLITTGTGKPNSTGKPQTENEKKLSK